VKKKKFFSLLLSLCLICGFGHSFAQEEEQDATITVDFKDADIKSVLRIFAEKGNVNIVSGDEVTGVVTIRLTDVHWQKALDVVLKTYGLGYEQEENIITVMPFDKLAEQKRLRKELREVEPLVTEVFLLNFLDASDARKVLQPMLSGRGRITIVDVRGKKGWVFGAGEIGKLARASTESTEGRSKTLIVSDIASSLKSVKEMLKKIDIMPKQVLIETKIVEVNKDRLKDLGIDWGTGTSGAESASITSVPLGLTDEGSARVVDQAGVHLLGNQVTPSVFNPEATGITAANTGLEILYQKLTGMQFEIILHALEESVDANTLSNPRILTLDNQEATILVGEKYPILKAQSSTADASTIAQDLDRYQDIGIQLNVVPQISGGNYINMIVHPAVSSRITTVGANQYPVLSIREVETQIFMKSGETIVIGGLLKDIKSKSTYSVPILGKIPILGMLFTRETNDIEKIDLLIFITAKIVETIPEPEATPQVAQKK